MFGRLRKDYIGTVGEKEDIGEKMDLNEWYVTLLLGLVVFVIAVYLFERSNISTRIKKTVGAVALIILGLGLFYINISSIISGGAIIIGLGGFCLVGGVLIILEQMKLMG